MLTVCAYSSAMYKYIAIMFRLQDSTIIFYYSISTIFNLSGNFLAPYLWEKLPVVYSLLFLMSCNYMSLFVIISA